MAEAQQQQQQGKRSGDEAPQAEVGAKVSSMREAVLAGAGAALKAGPGVAPAASSSAGAAVAKNMAGVYARQMMKSSWIAQVRRWGRRAPRACLNQNRPSGLPVDLVSCDPWLLAHPHRNPHQTDGQLLADVLHVLEGGCIYLPGFLCEAGDYSLLQSLTRDLKAYSEQTGAGLIHWSQHLKFEDPDFSPTFRTILRRLELYFDVEILATRHVARSGPRGWVHWCAGVL